jgi:DNA primase
LAKAKLSPELLQKIKDSVNIIELVGEHVVLRKSGANYTGLCPFHSERSPSFSVNESKQLYHCYGCKAGGDLVTFVKEILGVSFQEALDELADRGKVPLPADWRGHGDDPDQEVKNSAQREKLNISFKVNRFAAAFYHQKLASNAGHSSKGLVSPGDYLGSRGVGQDLIQAYYLGTAPDSWDALAHHFVAQKAPLGLAVELGLIRPSTKEGGANRGPGYFDLFRNRILFPIVNLRGKVAGFGGRILNGDTPKYLNSPESLIFQKGKLAFGLYQAQKYIREKDEVILVEGYFDVLALHAAGFQNVVATCGTSLTPDHLSILRRFCSKITILFDGDRAGITATERAMEVGLDQGIVLYGAQMPLNTDPDEILFDLKTGFRRSEGKDQMVQILKMAIPILDSQIERELQLAAQSAELKTQALKKIGKWLGRFRDPIGREVRVQLVQKQLGVSLSLIQEVVGKDKVLPEVKTSGPRANVSTSSGVPQRSRRIQATQFQSEKLNPSDQILLSGILEGGKALQLFLNCQERLPAQATLIDFFEYLPAKNFISTLLANSESLRNLKDSPKSLQIEGLDEKIREIFTSSLLSMGPSDGGGDRFQNFTLALSKGMARIWARFSQQIKRAISNAEIGKDIELQARLMKEYLDVQRKMKEFSSFYDEA